jgi:Family of unknown function (DUF6925)
MLKPRPEYVTQISEIFAPQIRNPASSWSMGSYGAVAEFFHDDDESAVDGEAGELIRITPRGGIRIELRDDVGICAFENSSSHGSTSQHIAFCLPEESSRMSVNTVLTELGQDVSALSDSDRDAILFDLGVSSLGSGCFQLDFCIRTSDSNLIDFLRRHCDKSIFEHDSPAFSRLLESQPHRVVITRLGRIEVYQPIGGEHTDDKTPEGPHTHLLPELLSLNLTHSTDAPIKSGWVPCAFLYPDEPVIDLSGNQIPLRANQ